MEKYCLTNGIAQKYKISNSQKNKVEA